MTWIERRPDDGDSIHRLTLQYPEAVPRIYPAAWIIGKRGQDLYFMPSMHKLSGKWQPDEEIGFGLEIVSNEEYSH